MRLLQRLLPTAYILTLAIALSACSSSGNASVIVGSEPSNPVQTPTPQVGMPEEDPLTPESTTEPVAKPAITPTEAPDDAGLVWTEVNPSDALGSDETSTIQLQSVGDGRILALSFIDRGMDSILVTENAREWNPISVPAGFLPWSVDIAGDRWLIQGWDSTLEAPHTQILYSDDEGANWTEIVVDLGSFDGTARVVDAIVAGKLVVVMAQSDTWQPENDQALDNDMGYEPSDERVHLFLSDGGPAELVAEFPGWASGGHGASDGFQLLIYGPDGDQSLTSPDGREWTRAAVDVEVTDSARNHIWTADEGYTDYRIERFEGVYGSGQVLTLPEDIGWVPGLAVGPAGIAMVGGPPWPDDEPDREFTLPDIVIEKDGYELRYNQPEGGISLWDLNQDEAVIVFDAETLQREEPPDVVQEVESDDGSILVVFYDPTTGAELVAFSRERLEAAVIEASIMEEDPTAYGEYDPKEFLVGWSLGGIDWQWQTLQEAFGLPESSEDHNSFTEVQVAVGQDFVLAKVQTFEFPEADIDEDFNVGVGDGQSGSVPAPLTAPEIAPSSSRWFIAQVD